MNILFIGSGSIGDAIISTGILSHLLDTYPQARFTLAMGAAPAQLFEAFPRLEKLIVIRKQPYNQHWLTLWNEVRQPKWDVVVDLRGSLLSYLVATKKRYVFMKPDKNLSKSEQLARLLKLDSPPPTRLWASVAAKAKADALLAPYGQKQWIFLAPKTNSAAKDWAIENFAELAKKLYKENIAFGVMASEAQKESVQFLVNAIPKENMLDLSGKTDLLTAFALLERAKLFIGNDSGLFHMAAAAGIPCVGIYGPSNDKVYAPRGNHVKIVKSHDFAMNEKEKRDNSYMQKISVDKVLEAALS